MKCRTSCRTGARTASPCCAPPTRRCTTWCWAAGTASRRTGRRSVTRARSRSCREEGGMSNTRVIPDPIEAGLARGWQVVDASKLSTDRHFDADVVVIGSGAGGGVTAEILALSGLKVIIVEEGALKSSRDFRMREADAYPSLYQESAARKTRDKGINILQGRSVGGSTTVNWTSSFRTPPATRAFWQQRYGLSTYTDE